MATIMVQLDEETQTFLARQIAEGRYPDAAAALQRGVRALQHYEREHVEKVEHLRAEIQKGIDSGPGVEATEAFARLRAKHGLSPRVR